VLSGNRADNAVAVCYRIILQVNRISGIAFVPCTIEYCTP
jgi:hypothetical protein